MKEYYTRRFNSLINKINEIDNNEFNVHLIEKLQEIESIKDLNTLESMFEKVVEDSNANKANFFHIASNEISIELSKYSLDALGRAISKGSNESEVCLCAFTKYNCKLCGKEKLHENSCIPSICVECGIDIATNMIRMGYNLEK